MTNKKQNSENTNMNDVKQQEPKQSKNKKPTALQAAQAEVAEYKDLALRRMAELENYRKNNANLAKDVRERTVSEVIEAILPALDGFARAEELSLDEKVKSGIEIIKEQFLQVLKKYNVTEIEAVGKEFDPSLHECIMQVDDAEMAGKVKYEIQKGYKIGGKVLRYSRVAVAKSAE